MNIMMKKVVLFIVMAIMAVSCLKDTVFEQSRTIQASFEYTDLNPERDFDEDSLYVGNGFLPWMDLVFHTALTEAEPPKFLGGHVLSMAYDSTMTNDLKRSFKFNSAFKPPLQSREVGVNNVFAVFYDNPNQEEMPENDITFANAKIGTCHLQGCFVINTTQVVNYVINNFKDDDYLKLTAIGYEGVDAEGQKLKPLKETGRAEIFLAKYSTSDEVKDSVITNWTVFDLSDLGDVDFVDFSLESNHQKIPPYFCYDLFTANIHLSY